MEITIPLARRDVIAERLGRGEPVVAAALAAEFDVSEDAIRRDLRSLAAEGRCRRVYGGALPLLPESKPMAARVDESRDRKAALARRAAATVQPGEFIFLDAGSTNLLLAECLPEDHVGTVATNSIDIAAAVLRRGDLSLLMVGGSVDLAERGRGLARGGDVRGVDHDGRRGGGRQLRPVGCQPRREWRLRRGRAEKAPDGGGPGLWGGGRCRSGGGVSHGARVAM